MKVTGYVKGKPVEIDVDIIDDRGNLLRHDAAAAYRAMAAAALEEAGLRLRCNYGWRPHELQALWRKRYDAQLAEYKQGKRKKKPSAVARAGWSTHQGGISADINRAHDDDTDNGIADGVTDTWLQANARRFGFVNDVPGEPWHWTFIGWPAS